jgi:2-polyprenyl-3-methyl-5-hydroxy-6-metoxy-1,4-benzoquinol methylase
VIEEELLRLSNLGWKVPLQDNDGIFSLEVDEDSISFPSEGYTGEVNNSEAAGFWALERANSIGELLNSINVNTLWEIGAGNGNAAIPLRDQGFNVLPIEPLSSGALTLVKNGFTTFQATLDQLNFPDNSINAIGAFDVLEHLENPDILLDEVFRILKPGGAFICSVPAYQWLFSDFDLSIGHYRRYSRKSLNTILRSAGFQQQSTNSLFGFLVLPAFVLRRIPFLLGRRNSYKETIKSSGGNSHLVESLSRVLVLISRLERHLKIPVGLSIISISKKSI